MPKGSARIYRYGLFEVRPRSEHGISFLHITPDLSTAYQIGDAFYVLYRGAVVEQGTTTAIIDRPRHPCVQLLIASVPVPDPRQCWQTRIDLPKGTDTTGQPAAGCPFYARCPQRMERCLVAPPLYTVDQSTGGTAHRAACYLYEADQPSLYPMS